MLPLRILFVAAVILAFGVWRQADLITLIFLIILAGGYVYFGWTMLRHRLRVSQSLRTGKENLKGEIKRSFPPQHGNFVFDMKRFHEDRKKDPTAEPADYLNSDVLSAHHNALPNALPGVFTAVGLLGTFVGIAIGLTDIDSGADGSISPESIQTLLDGMSTAFLTSIAGILLSLAWLFEFRHVDKKVNEVRDSFLEEADRLYPIAQPHQLLATIRDAVAGENGKSIGDLGETTSRIRQDISGLSATAKEIKGNVQSLGQDLAEHLEPIIERGITIPLKTLNAEIGERQSKALAKMVQAFQETLAASIGEHLKAFSEALRSATDHQVNAAQELGRFFDRLEEVGKTQIELLESTVQAVKDFRSGVTGLAEARGAIEEAALAGRETMKTAEGVMEEIRRLSDSQREWSNDLGRLVPDLTEKIHEFRFLTAEKIQQIFKIFDSEMAKVTNHLGGTLAEMREITTEIRETTLPLPQSLGDFRDAVSGLGQAIQDQRDSAGKFAEEIGRAGDRVAESVDRNLAAMQAAVKQSDASRWQAAEEIGKAMTVAEIAASRIESVANSAIGTMNKMIEATDSGFADSGKYRRKLTQLIQGMAANVEKIGNESSTEVGRHNAYEDTPYDTQGGRSDHKAFTQDEESQIRESRASRGDVEQNALPDQPQPNEASLPRSTKDETGHAPAIKIEPTVAPKPSASADTETPPKRGFFGRILNRKRR